jgi:hypothetical protein
MLSDAMTACVYQTQFNVPDIGAALRSRLIISRGFDEYHIKKEGVQVHAVCLRHAAILAYFSTSLLNVGIDLK